MYSGLIIKESIIDEGILDRLNVTNVQLWRTDYQPKYWTSIAFTSDDEDFPCHLSCAMAAASESGMVWYVDLKKDSVKYIVLKDVVLRYHIGNESEKNAVCEKCIQLGIKKEQLDWLE